METRKTKKRKGGAYLIVFGAIIIMSLTTALVFSKLSQTTYQSQYENLSVKADYISQIYVDATVHRLSTDEVLLKSISKDKEKQERNIRHKDSNDNLLATINISMILEEHKYFGKTMDWVAIKVTTQIEDNRPGRVKKAGEKAYFNYTSYAYVLKEDTSIRVYNKKLS